jgi:hypothetical protein
VFADGKIQSKELCCSSIRYPTITVNVIDERRKRLPVIIPTRSDMNLPIRCCETYPVAAVRAIRHFVNRLRPTAIRQYCINRIQVNDALDRGRTYYLDAAEIATNNRLTLSGSPVGNVHVCVRFFAFATGKSTNFLYQPHHRTRDMLLNLESNVIRPTPKEDAIILFMKDLSQYYQLSPDKDFVFLPFPKRSVVHDIYMDTALDYEQCHRAFFLRVWRSNRLITHIKLRKHLLFALCDTCVDFRDLQLVHHTTAERLLLKRAQLEHHEFVKAERQLYYYRRDKGANPLDDSLSMIVDAADQSAYALPYHYITTHTSQKTLRAPVHLMGVLIHGHAVHAYTYFENFKQGNNVTIEAMHSSLADHLARNGSLPSTLYIQLDNTTKQCKGRYMIGWLGYLILTGLFTTIVLSFLPVGHTHEDIDQIFSRLSVYLACHDAFNMEQLHEAIRGSYQTKEGHRAKCEFWDRCTNFSDWIAPYLSKYDGISGLCCTSAGACAHVAEGGMGGHSWPGSVHESLQENTANNNVRGTADSTTTCAGG